jgi:hypothetical protein
MTISTSKLEDYHMSETDTASTGTNADKAAAFEAEDTYLFYVDEETNIGPGEFVMHGVNCFFKRGSLTGPVTATIASIVTGRAKPPTIRIATEDEIKRLGTTLPPVVTDEKKSGGVQSQAQSDTKTSPDGKGDDPSAASQTGGGSTVPDDPTQSSAPATERKPKAGTKLTTG